MNKAIKCFYLTYNGRVATPNFENGDGVASKVVALCDDYAALGYDMELHADMIYKTVNNGSKDEQPAE